MQKALTFAPGNVVEVRDEEWLITSIDESADGPVLNVQGLADLVRGQGAVVYPSLDRIKLNDPRDITVRPDDSPKYRRSASGWSRPSARPPCPSDATRSPSRRILARQVGLNGSRESFAELVRLLDPTSAVNADGADGAFDAERVEQLRIRRHRHSAEVAEEGSVEWAERLEPSESCDLSRPCTRDGRRVHRLHAAVEPLRTGSGAPPFPKERCQ